MLSAECLCAFSLISGSHCHSGAGSNGQCHQKWCEQVRVDPAVPCTGIWLVGCWLWALVCGSRQHDHHHAAASLHSAFHWFCSTCSHQTVAAVAVVAAAAAVTAAWRLLCVLVHALVPGLVGCCLVLSLQQLQSRSVLSGYNRGCL